MSTIDRTLIREFFDFDLEWTPRCWWRKPLNIIVFFVSCWLWYDHTIWVGGFAAVLGFVGVHLLWTKSQQDHRRRRELRFGELASYTRAIQAGDVTRAFLCRYRPT